MVEFRGCFKINIKIAISQRMAHLRVSRIIKPVIKTCVRNFSNYRLFRVFFFFANSNISLSIFSLPGHQFPAADARPPRHYLTINRGHGFDNFLRDKFSGKTMALSPPRRDERTAASDHTEHNT